VNTPQIGIDIVGVHGAGLRWTEALKEMPGDLFIAIFMEAFFQGDLDSHFYVTGGVVPCESASCLLSQICS